MENYAGGWSAYRNCLSSFLSCLSTTNGTKGSKEAIKKKATLLKLHLYFDQHCNSQATYAINKTPCAHPTYLTAIGWLKKYLSGIAINNNTI